MRLMREPGTRDTEHDRNQRNCRSVGHALSRAVGGGQSIPTFSASGCRIWAAGGAGWIFSLVLSGFILMYAHERDFHVIRGATSSVLPGSASFAFTHSTQLSFCLLRFSWHFNLALLHGCVSPQPSDFSLEPSCAHCSWRRAGFFLARRLEISLRGHSALKFLVT